VGSAGKMTEEELATKKKAKKDFEADAKAKLHYVPLGCLFITLFFLAFLF
jgi:hypothetical protein